MLPNKAAGIMGRLKVSPCFIIDILKVNLQFFNIIGIKIIVKNILTPRFAINLPTIPYSYCTINDIAIICINAILVKDNITNLIACFLTRNIICGYIYIY